MNSTIKQRVAKWDNTKFILIWLVVIGHFAQYYTGKSESMQSLFIFLYLFHMPAFIFITGLFGKRVIKEHLYNKVINYFVIYFFMKALIYLTRFVLGENPSFKLLTEGGVPWFIFAIAVYYLITMFIKCCNPKAVLFVSLSLALFAGYDNSIGDYLMLSRIIVFYPFFYMGYILDKDKVKEFLEIKHIKILSLCSLLIIAFICVKYIDIVYGIRPLITGRWPYSKLALPEYGVILRLLYYVVSSIMVIAFISIIPDGRFYFTDMGTRTLQVYVLHRPIIYIWYAYNLDGLMQMIYPAHWRALTVFGMGTLVTVVLSSKQLLLMFNKICKKMM